VGFGNRESKDMLHAREMLSASVHARERDGGAKDSRVEEATC
jgi:hypothetical protein